MNFQLPDAKTTHGCPTDQVSFADTNSQEWIDNFTWLPSDYQKLKDFGFTFKSGSMFIIDKTQAAICTLVRKDDPNSPFHNTWSNLGGSVEQKDNNNVLKSMARELAQELCLPATIDVQCLALSFLSQPTLSSWCKLMGIQEQKGDSDACPSISFALNFGGQSVLKKIQSMDLNNLSAEDTHFLEAQRDDKKLFIAATAIVHLPLEFAKVDIVEAYKARREAMVVSWNQPGQTNPSLNSHQEKNCGLALIQVPLVFGKLSDFNPKTAPERQMVNKPGAMVSYYVDISKMAGAQDYDFLDSLKQGAVATPKYFLTSVFNNAQILSEFPFCWKLD